MRRRRFGPHVSHERWLISYADFVTLLFAFFVVLYASAQVDRQRAVRLSGAISSAFQQLGVFPAGSRGAGDDDVTLPLSTPGDAGQNISPPDTPYPRQAAEAKARFAAMRNELEKALAAEIRRNEVALHMEPEGLVVSLREVGFFDSGSATIKPGAEDAFGRVALILREHPCALRIEGHTDNVPIHTTQFASNWELSNARATGLVKTLIEKYGISADRLSAAGYAEFHPVASNSSPKGRQLNRRVDVVILRND
ncbi:MAG TPA: flagellar motor protein MotB [Candidatus Binatia bacterium]|nr:flagellar motor protein MotB [Candidatus Binatia bacterium]